MPVSQSSHLVALFAALDGVAKARVTPNVAGIAHVILSVEDDGTPSLSSYRRVILRIKKP